MLRYDNIGLWTNLDSAGLEPLLNKAKKSEKKYKWLQAADYYRKASSLALDKKDLLKAADIQENLGFCFYKAALQAKSNTEFKKILEQSISAYESESKLLEGVDSEIGPSKMKHADALVAYMRSRYETDSKIIKKLLGRWWTLENHALKMYEAIGDLHSAGRIRNDLIEYSSYTLFWLPSNFSEIKRIFEAIIDLSEKAIEIFRELDDDYELARAYCSASWFYSFGHWYFEENNRIIEFAKKFQDYTKKALEFAHKVGDAWIIGRAYHSAWNAVYLGETDLSSAMGYGDKLLEYGAITKDNYLLGNGNTLKAWANTQLARSIEDPEKQKETLENAIESSLKAQHSLSIIQHTTSFLLTYTHYADAISSLASIEPDPIKKQKLLEKATKVLEDAVVPFQGWNFSYILLLPLSANYQLVSETKSKNKEKRKLLNQSEFHIRKAIANLEKTIPSFYTILSTANLILAQIQIAYANIESEVTKQIAILNTAIGTLEKCINLIEKRREILQTKYAYGAYFGRYYFVLGSILQRVYDLSKEKEKLYKALDSYETAVQYFTKAEKPTYLAESHWHLAQLFSHSCNFNEASKNYELASKAYTVAAEKIPQIRHFYEDYSRYMQAWSQIEQARYAHSIEDYEEAKEHYRKSAEFHKATERWNYLTSSYLAWASMEEAESLSRKENTQQAKQTFQKALEKFSIAEDSIKQKTEKITSTDEREMAQTLLKASSLRRKFCQARISIETAKLLDRKGKYLQSSKKYKEAAQDIDSIIEKVEFEAERKELRLIAVLCGAWEKTAVAGETTSSNSYLEAAELFERAKDLSITQKTSLWALGNSSFCKGLAAGIKYQTSLDLKSHANAKGHLKSAATSYFQAGFKHASEYAKATQRLFDAYLFMNQAEVEADQEKRAKQYQMAENLLQIAAGAFMKANQPEKTAQVQEILGTVKEEKALAASLNEVMQAPSIASSTLSFTAPSPTREFSVGLDQLQHANVQANLIAGLKEVKIGESFCLTVEFVNAGKEPALLTRVEDFVPSDFIVVKKPEIYRIEGSCLNMKGKQIAPLKLVEAKLVLQPSKKGVYYLRPIVHYLDETGQSKSLQMKGIEIRVEEVILADRVSTGTKEIDSLLLGGIPKEYTIVLTGPPSDERESIIKNFLEAGTKKEHTIFYVTTEADEIKNLMEKSGFYLFLCNPKPKIEVPDLPNVYKLHGKTDLTNLNIALLKAYRNIEQSSNKRVCINIISDVLVDYGVKATRKWIAELTTDLVSKKFTVLAVINPLMHASEELYSVLDLFDGEISLYQTEDPLECKKSLRIKKLRNQEYIKNPICLT